jgi:hypothetical protein
MCEVFNDAQKNTKNAFDASACIGCNGDLTKCPFWTSADVQRGVASRARDEATKNQGKSQVGNFYVKLEDHRTLVGH